MGRLLKKKDPDKKKAQRTVKSDSAAESKNDTVDSNKTLTALKKSPEPIKPKAATGEPNFLQNSIQFLREVKIELKKVTWPSRKQTIGSTAVVLVLVIIVSFYLGIVDFGLAKLIRAVLP